MTCCVPTLYIVFFLALFHISTLYFQRIAVDVKYVASPNKDDLFKYPSLDYLINSVNAIQLSDACVCYNAFVILAWLWLSSRSRLSGFLQAHVEENSMMDRAASA